MAVVALILFDQGGPGTAGQAFEGSLASLVTITNDDDTDVASWRIQLVDVPPDSALVPGTLANADSGTPSASFTPDVAGSYRIVLDVWDGAGETGTRNRDIRNFGIRNAKGYIIPPYQKLPDPLPVTGSGYGGEKPDEQNYGGQARGWAGDRASGQLEEFFETHADMTTRIEILSGLTAPIPADDVEVVRLNPTVLDPENVSLPSSARSGKVFRYINIDGTRRVTITPSGGDTMHLGTLSYWTLLPYEGVDLLRVGTDWLCLGATRDMNELSLVASAEQTDLTGFQAIGASVLLDPADYPNTISTTWQAVIETTNAADAAEVRLYNVTTASVVASSTLSTTSLTPVVVSAAVTLTSGPNLYEAQLRLQTTGSPNQATCKQARLLIDTLG